jgi:hypothetical protein
MYDLTLRITPVTVSRVAHDNGHLGSLSLTDTALVFDDDNGSQIITPFADIKKVQTVNALTMRINCKGTDLQIWMYDYFSNLHRKLQHEEVTAIEQKSAQLLDVLKSKDVIIKVYSYKTAATVSIAFLIGLVLAIVLLLFKVVLFIPVGIFIIIPIIAYSLSRNMGARKEAAHNALVNK